MNYELGIMNLNTKSTKVSHKGHKGNPPYPPLKRGGILPTPPKRGIRVCLFVCILLCIMSMSIGCSPRGEVLRIPLTHMPITFDPMSTDDYLTLSVNRNIFETLATVENNETVPLLAVKWYALTDNIFVIQIREDVRFSNGVPMKVEDVVASLYRAINFNDRINNIDTIIDSIVTANENTIQIHGSRFEHITLLMQNTFVYNADYLKKFDDLYLKDNPLGTGSYFVYLNSPARIVLQKNVFHRNFQNSRRNASTIVLLHEPSVERHYEMLQNNEVDFLLQLPLSAYHDVFVNRAFQYTELPSNFIFYMMFDATRTSIPEYNLPLNPLRNRKIRLAIAHALDMESFIDDKLLGRANLLVIPAMRNLIGYPGLLEYYRFDLEYSRQLLYEAGFSDGFKLNIRVHDTQYSEALSEFIVYSLSQINIDVSIQLYESNNFFISFSESIPPALITYIPVTTVSDNILESLNKLFTVDSPMNPMRNNSLRVLYLLDRIAVMNEYDILLPMLYRELVDEIYSEAIIIPFFQPYNLYVYGNNITLDNANHFLYSNIKVVR